MAFPAVTRPRTPANVLTAKAAPIGGIPAQGIGGYIYLFQSIPIGPTGRQDKASVLWDVKNWQVAESFGEVAFAKGGMMGAMSSRRTHYAYVWEAAIWRDMRVNPEAIFRGANDEFNPNLQIEAYFTVGTSIGQAGVAPRYRWCPRCKIDRHSQPMEANGRIQLVIGGVTNAHFLHLPDQGDPQDFGTLAGAYQQWVNEHQYD